MSPHCRRRRPCPHRSRVIVEEQGDRPDGVHHRNHVGSLDRVRIPGRVAWAIDLFVWCGRPRATLALLVGCHEVVRAVRRSRSVCRGPASRSRPRRDHRVSLTGRPGRRLDLHPHLLVFGDVGRQDQRHEPLVAAASRPGSPSARGHAARRRAQGRGRLYFFSRYISRTAPASEPHRSGCVVVGSRVTADGSEVLSTILHEPPPPR